MNRTQACPVPDIGNSFFCSGKVTTGYDDCCSTSGELSCRFPVCTQGPDYQPPIDTCRRQVPFSGMFPILGHSQAQSRICASDTRRSTVQITVDLGHHLLGLSARPTICPSSLRPGCCWICGQGPWRIGALCVPRRRVCLLLKTETRCTACKAHLLRLSLKTSTSFASSSADCSPQERDLSAISGTSCRP